MSVISRLCINLLLEEVVFIQTVVVIEGFKMDSGCFNVIISPVALTFVNITYSVAGRLHLCYIQSGACEPT